MKEIRNTVVKSKLQDVYLTITWAKIADRYFGKSTSWMYNKMNGRDGNGGDGEFTSDEVQILKDALYDFANRVKACADNL